jgi:hypothetical protein
VVEEQIQSLQAKIAEKHGSQDKLDLWLVRHWQRQIEILKQKENEN